MRLFAVTLLGLLGFCSNAVGQQYFEISKSYMTANPDDCSSYFVAAHPWSMGYDWTPSYVIDGQYTSDPCWHSGWAPGQPWPNYPDQYNVYPQWVRVRLYGGYNIGKVQYYPRAGVANGSFNSYKIYVTETLSNDPAQWGSPVAEGNWSWPNGAEIKTVTFSPKFGRYVIFRTDSGVGGWASAGEVWIYEAVTAPTVATPVISPGTGLYHWEQPVQISCNTPGATIFYSVDGSFPSTTYTGMFTAGAQTIRARAVKSGMNDSAETSVTYTVEIWLDDTGPWGNGSPALPFRADNTSSGQIEPIPTLQENGWYVRGALPANSTLNWFDQKMRYITNPNHPWMKNVTIRLKEGTYMTRSRAVGFSLWSLQEGQKLIGAGSNLTTVRRINTDDAYGKDREIEVFSSNAWQPFQVYDNSYVIPSRPGSRNVEVRELTADANFASADVNSPKWQTSCAAINLDGGGTVQNVRAIGVSGNTETGSELYGIRVYGGPSSPMLIEGCTVNIVQDGYISGICPGGYGVVRYNYVTLPIFNYASDPRDSNFQSRGYNLVDSSGLWLYGNHSWGGVTGLYTDTGWMNNIHIYNNVFLECVIGIHFFRGNDPTVLGFPVSHVFIHDNQVRLHKSTIPFLTSTGIAVVDSLNCCEDSMTELPDCWPDRFNVCTSPDPPLMMLSNFDVRDNDFLLNSSFQASGEAIGLEFSLAQNSVVSGNVFQRCVGSNVLLKSYSRYPIAHSNFSGNTSDIGESLDATRTTGNK